jgi:hypothetical protein
MLNINLLKLTIMYYFCKTIKGHRLILTEDQLTKWRNYVTVILSAPNKYTIHATIYFSGL